MTASFMLVRKGIVQRYEHEEHGRNVKCWPVTETRRDARKLARYWKCAADVRPAGNPWPRDETWDEQFKLALKEGCERVICVAGWNADGSPRWKWFPLVPGTDEARERAIAAAFEDYEKAIAYCVKEGLGNQALILAYSAIDFASWLNCPGKSSGVEFMLWVDKYLLPGSGLSCTAKEIWGARCGLVHTVAPGSDVSRKDPGTRELVYAWTAEKAAQLHKRLANRKQVATPIEPLIAALRAGLNRFQADIAANPALLEQVRGKGHNVLRPVSREEAEERDLAQELRWVDLLR